MTQNGVQEWRIQNPYTGKEIFCVPLLSEPQIEEKIEKAKNAFAIWRKTSAYERSRYLLTVAQELRKLRDEFAQMLCDEVGKPISLARIEVDRGISVLEWASAEALRFTGEMIRTDVFSNGRNGWGIYTRFPRGVILGITPYNFPLNLVLHKVAPALACGAVILIKPSPYSVRIALRLEKLFEQLFHDENEKVSEKASLIQVLPVSDADAARLTQASEISMVSFTGSAAVGFQIRKQVSQKPLTLELGGNAWVVLDQGVDAAQLERIAKKIGLAAFGYAGQSCISVQNVAIHEDHWSLFKQILSSVTEQINFGDPANESVQCGPLIHSSAAQKIRNQLNLCRLERVESHNFVGESCERMVAPTLLIANSQAELDQHPQWTEEEVFGPVMMVSSFVDTDELIHRVNRGRYGLQAGLFTQNLKAVEKFYCELRVGGVMVNDVPTTRYDHQPYGGMKDSGQGREGIRFAMEEMTEGKFLSLSSCIT